jgi:hypothetical protein
METSLGIIAGCAATMRPLLRGFGFRYGTKGSAASRSVAGPPPPQTRSTGTDEDKPPVDIFHSTRTELDITQEVAAVQSHCQAQNFDSFMSTCAVHVKTSVEVKSERSSDDVTPSRLPLPSGLPLRSFRSYGDSSVTINGKGLSDNGST